MAKSLIVKIIGDPSELSHGLHQATRETETFGQKLGSVVKAGALIAAAGIGVAGVAVEKFGHAALEEQAVNERLAAQLQALGVNYQEHAAQIDEVIQKQEDLSGFSKEDLLTSFTALARVTKGDLTKAFEDNALAADIARGKGIQLAAAQGIVTKASLGMVGALRRQGIDVQKVTDATDALKDAHGKVTQAMKDAAKASDLEATKQELLATLQSKFAGQAEAYGNTAAGAFDRFHNAVHDLEVSLGTALLPTLTNVANKLSDTVGWVQHFIEAVKSANGELAIHTRSQVTAATSVAHTGATMDAGTAAAIRHQEAIRQVNDALASLWQHTQNAIAGLVAFGQSIANAYKAVKRFNDDLGNAIKGSLRAFEKWSYDLNETVIRALQKVGETIKGWAGSAYAYAFNIGRAIVDGIIGGLGDLAGRVGSAIGDAVHGAIGHAKSLLGIHSPSTVAGDEIGKPLAEGIIEGFLLGSAQLPAKVADSVRKALEAGKAAIDAGRSGLQAAWGNVATDVGAAFDAIAGGMKTKSEKLLAAMDAKAATEQLQRNLQQAGDAWATYQREMGDAVQAAADAQHKLEEAQAGTTDSKGVTTVNPDAVESASVALREANQKVADMQQQKAGILQNWTDAQNAIVRAGLEKRAAEERLQLDATNALRKRHLDEQLTDLEANFEKQGRAHDKAQKQIIALLNSYGIDYKKSGLALGTSFATGIEESIGAAVAAAQKLAAAVDRYLPHSPAKEGPLSVPPNWDALLPGFNVAGARGTMNTALAGAGGGGPMRVHVYIDGQELHGVNIKQAQRYKRQNGTTGLT